MSFPLTVSTDNDQDMQDVSGSDDDQNSDPVRRNSDFHEGHICFFMSSQILIGLTVLAEHNLKNQHNFKQNLIQYLICFGALAKATSTGHCLSRVSPRFFSFLHTSQKRQKIAEGEF